MVKRFTLSCREATDLTEQKLRGELPLLGKARLFFHQALCGACRRYERQSRLLERFFSTKKAAAQDLPKAPGLEEKILSRIEEQERDETNG